MYELGEGGVEKCLQKASELYNQVVADTRPDRDNKCGLFARCNLALMRQPNVTHKCTTSHTKRIYNAAGKGMCAPCTKSTAVEYWTKAAEQGHSEAAYHLGNLLAGDGLEMRSQKDAGMWWFKAGGQGHANAQCRTAALCESGAYSHIGVKNSSEAAFQWYEKIATQSHIASPQKREQGTLLLAVRFLSLKHSMCVVLRKVARSAHI